MNDAPVPNEPRREDYGRVANPFGGTGTALAPTGALAQAEQQRSIAEVQARMIIARANPRDPIKACEQILLDCTRPTLAERALYSYARGGTDITGPSIRLAEAIAQRWGNIASGFKELARANGYSEVVAYAWDLQSGYYDERQFQVRHWRDTKQGGRPVSDERDIYELVANAAQRRKRAVLLAVIPGDVVEAAITQCEDTLHATADTSPAAMQRMLDTFAEYEVTREQIEKRIQRRIDAIRPAQVVLLRKIYSSLHDGMSEPSDWFEAEGAAPGGVWGAIEQGHAAAAAQTENGPAATAGATRRSNRKAAAKEPTPEVAPTDRAPTTAEGPYPSTEETSTRPSATVAHTNPPTSASAGEGARPTAGAALGTSAPEASQPAGASGVAFTEWLIDGDGVAIDGTDVFTDPVAFAKAYATALEAMFPPERTPFIRANADALAQAAVLDPEGVRKATQPPPPAQTQPQQSQEDAPELPLGAEHDYAVVPRPTKPTRAAFIEFNDRLKAKVEAATDEPALVHISTVNADTISSMPNVYRLAAIEIIETRRKQLAPKAAPPARPATPPSVDSLLSDIYQLNGPESVAVWLQMPSVAGYLRDMASNDRDGWVKVMSAANAVYVRMRIEGCTTVAACDAMETDETVDTALGWLHENDAKAYDTVVAFAREHRAGLAQ